MTGNPVTLVNRTSEPIRFVADSRHYLLQPGDNHGFLEGHAPFAMRQNPLMGSQDYYSLDFISKVGVKVGGVVREDAPCDPITDEQLLAAMDEIEAFNRSVSGLREGQRVRPRVAMPRGRINSAADLTVLAVGGR